MSTDPAPSVVLPSVDPVVARALTPLAKTFEGSHTGAVSLASALLVFAIAMGWIRVDQATRDFILTMVPVAITVLAGVALVARTALKAWIVRQWLHRPPT